LQTPPDGEQLLTDYTAQLASRLRVAYDTVIQRQAQFAAANKARRDKSRVIAPIFKPGELVMYYEPNAVATNPICLTRPERKSEFKPLKWTFPWSGPHRILSGTSNPNVYKFSHNARPADNPMSANVDSLCPLTAFNDTNFDTAPGPLDAVQQHVPPRSSVGPDDTDLAFFCLPDSEHPLRFGRIITRSNEDNPNLVVHWCGHFKPVKVQDIAKCHWLTTWIQRDERIYYLKGRLHHDHVPYTNTHTAETVLQSNIICSNMKLNSKFQLQKESATRALIKIEQLIQDLPDDEDAVKFKNF
jgi:hypothetical protein